jgi:hypothetical protein
MYTPNNTECFNKSLILTRVAFVRTWEYKLKIAPVVGDLIEMTWQLYTLIDRK